MSGGLKIVVFITLCLIWSSTWIMIKVGLKGAPPITAAGLRFIIASILVFSIILGRRIPIPRTRRFLWLSLYLGLFQMGLPYALVYWAELHISSGLTSVLFSTMPLTVAVLARVMLGDPLTIPKVGGILIGTLGVTVLSYQTFIIPVLACLIGWIFLRETVTIKTAIGGGLILAGIAFATFPFSREKRSVGA